MEARAGPWRPGRRALLAGALAALVAAGAPAASARPYWEDDSFVAELAMPEVPVPQARAAHPHRADAGSLLEERAQEEQEEQVEERPARGGLRRAPSFLAESETEGEAEPRAASLEPPMSYGDSGSFERFREAEVAPEDLRREAVAEGPFGGGASRQTPVEHRVAAGPQRFESPSFTEVFSQLKEIMADPRGEQALRASSNGAERHLLSSVSARPQQAPPLAPAPPHGLQDGPPIPVPPPVLTPITHHPQDLHSQGGGHGSQGHDPSAHSSSQPRLSRAVFGRGQNMRFKMVLDESARLRLAHPHGASLVEAGATARRTESPEATVHRLLAEREERAPAAALPAFKPVPTDMRVLGHPLVHYD